MHHSRSIALAFLLTASPALADYLGPSAYRQASDSPFASTAFSSFFLEDFEDSSLNTLGVTASGGAVVGPSGLTDSVDADDGLIDGLGRGGHSFYSAGAIRSLTFTFDQTALGALPTHAGIVWTDVGVTDPGTPLGNGAVSFEAFDAAGVSLGVFGPALLGDGNVDGFTDEDRFFGVVHLGGISKFTISIANSGDWEVDHLQYGIAIPAPAPLALAGLGLTALARRRRA